MPNALPEASSTALLETLPDAQGQSFHCDSLEPGASGVTAYEEDQFLYVLHNGFRAMLVLLELKPDRKEATDLVRSLLAAQSEPAGSDITAAEEPPQMAARPPANPVRPQANGGGASVFSDADWINTVEPRVWQALVHEEFKARKVGHFEVLRVRVKRSKTIVLDSRCPHAGAPWTGSPGCKRLYRGHFYGFRRDVMRRVRESPTDKDEYTTVDLCSSDFFPLASWGQLGEKGPIFA
jgi:hypothetical protein